MFKESPSIFGALYRILNSVVTVFIHKFDEGALEDDLDLIW